MPKVKHAVAAHKRKKRVMKAAEGQWGGRSRFHKRAMESVAKGMMYSYRDRKARKRDFRSLWIVRINAACKANGMTYSRFIEGLIKADITLNRKMLSEIAIYDEAGFIKLVQSAKAALA